MLHRTIHRAVEGRQYLLGGLGLAAILIVTVGVVRAVNLTGPDLFEINDGNVTDEVSPTTPDWASLFDGSAQTVGPPPGPVAVIDPIPGGGVASQFAVDPLAFDPLVGQEPVAGGGACLSGSGDPTVYTGAGGEKNGDVLSTDTWGAGSIPNNKDDLSNVYTAAYDRGDGKLILYFGLERVATNGSAHVDFEFYHDTVGLVADSPDAANGCEAGHFTGTRADGDIVITMDFDNGGRLGNPEVRRFNGVTGKYVVITPAASSIGITQNGVDTPCGSWECRDTNGNPTDTLIANAFVEGFLDTGDPQVNFEGCLSSFNVHTRSSPSFTATLKDFALGSFNTCSTKSGQKFQDTNGNGVKDFGEPGLNGWDIKLFADPDANGILSGPEFTAGALATKTTATVGTTVGAYSFTGLNAGDYIVCEVAQSTWTESFPNASTTDKADCSTSTTLGPVGWKVHLTASTHDINNDFGNFQQGTKSGVKFKDLNANGTKDAGDPGLNGWTIRAYTDTNGDGVLQAGETTFVSQTTATANSVDGAYEFSLDPGKYVVCEVLQATWIQSAPSGNTKCSAVSGLGAAGFAVTITSGSSEVDNDFGNYQNITKSGVKFQDDNANGVKDSGEPGLNDWTITAYTDANGDGILQAGETTSVSTTTATVDTVVGSYSFSLKPGAYIVCETLKSTWIQSFPTTGAACPGSTLGYAIDLTSGQTDTNNDFGNYQNITKSGVKFSDNNNNGVKDSGEPGLDGWTITAYTDANGDGILQAGETTSVSTTTATVDTVVGSYSFSLKPGAYIVCETQQAGWHQSFPTSGPTCPDGTLGYAIDLTSGQTDSNNDFGNNKLFRLIILTCSEVDQTLVVSTVDSDGTFGNGDDKDTIATAPTLSGFSGTQTDLQNYLCNLGGAQYNNLSADDYPKTTRIPK